MDSDTEIEITGLRSEIGSLKVDIAILASEIVRLRESLHSTNRGCLALVSALDTLKKQNIHLQSQITILESWVGVPNVSE